jgi:putative thioredoxin
MTPTQSPFHFDATTANFEQDVLARSMETPVLIDFWAPWCSPCMQLKPVLEKLADEYAGGFVLAKVNSDDEAQIAALFGVRSLPTVVLLKGGRPVDGFMGVQPESALRQFLAQHAVAPLEAIAEIETLEAIVDPAVQLATLRARSAAEPENDEIKLDIALLLASAGDVDEAAALLDALPDRLAKDDRTLRARATLGFATRLKDAPSHAELEQRVQADAADLDARHLLGVHKLVAGDEEGALQEFIDMLQRDKSFQEGLPRRLLIDAFAVISDPDLVSRYRRRMASLLF